ncbi:MAG: large-conductance mechanosensitive channel protein MscL [Kiritimatiellia bacterium]|jgi:large conductance mechanosensitive channel
MSIIQEFKEFAIKGNVIDMAVGIIIGGAFGKIVTSLVNDVIMPPIGVILGGVDFKDLAITLKAGVPATETTPEIPAVMLRYGAFIQTVTDFLIVAAAVFILIKAINSIRRKTEELAAARHAETLGATNKSDNEQQ